VTGREAWHGTIGGYNNHGCRQECCRAAKRAHHRSWRQRARRERMPQDVPHSTLNAYSSYGCRCRACRDHVAAYARAWRRKREAAS
jgi:hypothetical protein